MSFIRCMHKECNNSHTQKFQPETDYATCRAHTVKSGFIPTCSWFGGSSGSEDKSCPWPTSGWALSGRPALSQLQRVGLLSKFGARDDLVGGATSGAAQAVFVVLGTGLTDEVGQNSDMDNPGCDCLIVHWAVLNISLFSCNCTQSASGMPTSLRPAK